MNIEIENSCVQIQQNLLPAMQLHKLVQVLHTISHLENERPKIGNDFADA